MSNLSITENAGIPFEHRCADAKVFIESLSSSFQRISDKQIQNRQRSEQHRDALFAGVRGVDTAHIENCLTNIIAAASELSNEFYKIIWESGLKFSREMYGLDATDFALKLIDIARTAKSN